MTLMTGISMFGKMSVGIVTIDRSPSTAISSATTTNVYGRRRASRTIHMTVPEATVAPRPVVEDHWENARSCGTTVCTSTQVCAREAQRDGAHGAWTGAGTALAD